MAADDGPEPIELEIVGPTGEALATDGDVHRTTIRHGRRRRSRSGDDPGLARRSLSVRSRPARTVAGVAVVVVAVAAAVAVLGDPDRPGGGIRAVLAVSSGDTIALASGPSRATPTQRWSDPSLGGCRGVLAAAAVDDVVVTTVFGDLADGRAAGGAGTDGFTVVGRDETSGGERWRFDLGASFATDFVPVSDGRLLVVATGLVVIVDIRDGTELARRKLTRDHQVISTQDAVLIVDRGSGPNQVEVVDFDLDERFRVPLADPDDVVLATDGAVAVVGGDRIRTVDLADGAGRWVADVPDVGPATTTDDLVVAGLDGEIVAFDLDDGRERWRRPAADDLLQGSSTHVAFTAPSVEPGAESQTVTVVDRDGRERWQTDAPDFLAAVRGGSEVFITLDGGRAVVWDATTGAEVSGFEAEDAVALDADRLWIADGEGALRAVDLGSGTLLATVPVSDEVCGLRILDGGLLVSTPAALAFWS